MIIKQPGVEEISQLRQLWKEAFGDTDSFLDIFFSAAFAPERCRCVLADGAVDAARFLDGKPIGLYNMEDLLKR